MFHIQQAVEKYLKGYLLSRGWALVKTHDIELLINTAKDFDPEFNEYLDLGRFLTDAYMGERYPPTRSSNFSTDEVQQFEGDATSLVDLIFSKSQIHGRARSIRHNNAR